MRIPRYFQIGVGNRDYHHLTQKAGGRPSLPQDKPFGPQGKPALPSTTATAKGSARWPPSGASIFAEFLCHGCPSRLRVKSRDLRGRRGCVHDNPSEVQRRFFRELARASYAFPALDTMNPKPEMEACGQESFAALGGPWCITVAIRAAKMETPVEEHMEETK